MLKSVDQAKNASKTWILLGIPILLVVGSLMHFVYEWSGNLNIVGVFAPVNESVWEHLKLVFWPMLIWWIIGYFILNNKYNVPAYKWFISCAVAELFSLIFILAFYYTYTGALGIESLIVDISSLLIAIILAQLVSLHIYKYVKNNYFALIIAFFILILLIICFTVFTFNPPELPLFKDFNTGQYGI